MEKKRRKNGRKREEDRKEGRKKNEGNLSPE